MEAVPFAPSQEPGISPTAVQSAAEDAAPWPQLREDLTLHRGPSDRNGAPVWTLHDPARNQYFSIDWLTFEVISRLSLGDAQAVAESINIQTTLHVDEQEVLGVLRFMEEHELVQRHDPDGIEWLRKRRELRNKGAMQHLIHSYLFFRLPLLRPDAWLSRVTPHFSFFFSRTFLLLTLFAFVIGLWGVYRQWSTFAGTLVDTFSLQGLLSYAGALVAVKFTHELGHALTAKRMGCRVPTMGIAFLVMYPMAYTDVTESWKLDSNGKRLRIAGAGIATEVLIAAWCLLLWTILPEGGLRGAVFFLATTSLTATLLINASPFMRFDGYFLLCDVTGMPNLHARSFAMARWWLREKLFLFGDAAPEDLSVRIQRAMIAFALVTWIYRFIIFIGIAVLVYHFFFKALGIFLFVIEIWYFLARPIFNELMFWRKRLKAASESVAAFGTGVQVGDSSSSPKKKRKPIFYMLWAIFLILVLPFDFTVNTQGILKPAKSFEVIAFTPAQILAQPPAVGTQLVPGQVLMRMSSPELEHRTEVLQARVASLIKHAGSVGFESTAKAQQAILREQLQAAQQELSGLLAERSRLAPVTTFAGEVIDVVPDIHLGDWVPKGQRLATYANLSSWVVDTYVEESDLSRLEVGNWARFFPESAGLPTLSLVVTQIDRDATRVLNDPALAATAGGQILVRQKNQTLIPERSVFRVRLIVEGDPGKISTGHLRGSVVMLGWPRSIFGEFLRGAATTLVREMGF
ncbi:site-2 protease family protein [Zwartia sp.]|uniref:site-2 protease family protein n=1 Tax=Zwartia sp. TaxID=2978004 RepID=UPI00271DAD41|nr:site-2 protease family protein [Zwartia sp.]MDO9023112.1 secretion protein HylD [Zwartia sp.]